MEHRLMVWIGFFIVVIIGLAIGFYDWRTPVNLSSKARRKRAQREAESFGKHIFSSKTLRTQDQKDGLDSTL